MKALLDTHAFIWLHVSPGKLTARVREICEDKSSQLYLSVASVWEMKTKAQLGKLTLETPWQALVEESRQLDGLVVLDITLKHITKGKLLPFHHKDPFDRLLINQSQVEGIPIISADSQFGHYDVDVIW